jgi:histidinol dehydrogenase
VLEYTAKFDRVHAPSVAALEISGTDMRSALTGVPSDQRSALETAATRVRAYHERQKMSSWSYREADGSELGQQITAA